jgi:hypothetical protein
VPIVAEPADGVLQMSGDLPGLVSEISGLARVAESPLQRLADFVLVGIGLGHVPCGFA